MGERVETEHSDSTLPTDLPTEPPTDLASTAEPVRNLPAPNLPAPMGAPPPALPPALIVPRRRWLRGVLLLLLLLAIAGGGGFYWWQQRLSQLPPGIAFGNGRIEADEIDIATKFAGRVAALLFEEGDMVTAGQVVARMDTKDLEASLQQAEAQGRQAQAALSEAQASVTQRQTELTFAKQELDRTNALARRGNATLELLDQRRQQVSGASAALDAAQAHVAAAQHALDAAQHQSELIRVNIADNTLVAPRDGRIQYRIAQLGEVLPAGGKVATMIDIQSVYMDIYLPTLDAGRIAIGSEARIVLDAYPTIAIPATVAFVATQSQFTPKTVETRTERDRLMFRVRLRIAPALLKAHADEVRSGLPGIGYVRVDPQTAWPERLRAALAR